MGRELFARIGPPEPWWRMWILPAAIVIPLALSLSFIAWVKWLDHICIATGNC